MITSSNNNAKLQAKSYGIRPLVFLKADAKTNATKEIDNGWKISGAISSANHT